MRQAHRQGLALRGPLVSDPNTSRAEPPPKRPARPISLDEHWLDYLLATWPGLPAKRKR